VSSLAAQQAEKTVVAEKSLAEDGQRVETDPDVYA